MESTWNVMYRNRKSWAAFAALLFIILISLILIKTTFPAMNKNASINGILFDAISGKPVPDAIIMITGGTHEHPDIASQSDNEGHFSLPSLQIPGTYHLLVNYNERSKEITVNIEKQDTVLRIPL